MSQNSVINRSIPPGKMQATFVASSTLKRNRRYIDIDQINDWQKVVSARNRRPVTTSRSIENKIDKSFSNSTAAYTERRNLDIAKSQKINSSRPFSAPTKQPKGVSMNKLISRQQFYKRITPQVSDERLFNNFKLEKPKLNNTVNISKGLTRDFDVQNKSINDLYYDTEQLYQKYYYKSTTMDCRFHYKKQAQDEGRVFFKRRHPSGQPATDLNLKAVEDGEKKVKKQHQSYSFYLNSGRQLPSQLSNREGTNLTSYWRDISGKINKPNLEYSVRCLKQKLQDQKKKKIKDSKKPIFNRNEICDKKYFIVNSQV